MVVGVVGGAVVAYMLVTADPELLEEVVEVAEEVIPE